MKAGKGVTYRIAVLCLLSVMTLMNSCASREGSVSPQASPPGGSHHDGHGSTARKPAPEAMVNDTTPPGPAPAGMVWIPGGVFTMGCDDCGMPDAEPLHLVKVDGFWMDATPVTNDQFAKFVSETGYRTIAERQPDPKDYPTVNPADLAAGSAVFVPTKKEVSLNNPLQWWRYVKGATWQHPEGPGSEIKGRGQHPAVHIAWDDAVEYARWAGARLPTEAEFEFAARGGLEGKHFAWGDELKPDGKWVANIWQGVFPVHDRADDGFDSTSPVRQFPPNGFGLFDVGGNVWQWCSDFYRPDYFAELTRSSRIAVNPQGPRDSYDPDEPGIPKRVQKSGSFLCSDTYCSKYYVGSRGRGAPDSAGSNTGFRCVKSGK